MYKVGDLIKISSVLFEGDVRESHVYCAPEMLQYKGIIARITYVRSYSNSVVLYKTCKTGGWEWADDMIEGKVSLWNEK